LFCSFALSSLFHSTPIYSYAFALEAATWQPTSTLNFSRLDHVSLGLTFAAGIKASEMVSPAHSNMLVFIRNSFVCLSHNSTSFANYVSCLLAFPICPKLQFTINECFNLLVSADVFIHMLVYSDAAFGCLPPLTFLILFCLFFCFSLNNTTTAGEGRTWWRQSTYECSACSCLSASTINLLQC
jgi:hypothetical protein